MCIIRPQYVRHASAQEDTGNIAVLTIRGREPHTLVLAGAELAPRANLDRPR
jgi:hypothetical protein